MKYLWIKKQTDFCNEKSVIEFLVSCLEVHADRLAVSDIGLPENIKYKSVYYTFEVNRVFIIN